MIVQRAPIRDRTPQLLVLPIPPSSGQSGSGHSQNLLQWRDTAGQMLIEQRPRRHLYPVEIEITFAAQKRHSEIAPRIAPLLGLLVQHGVIPTSDSTIVRKVSAAWGNVGKCELVLRSAA